MCRQVSANNRLQMSTHAFEKFVTDICKKPYLSWWNRSYCSNRRRLVFAQTKTSSRKSTRAPNLGFWHRRYQLPTRCWIHGSCRKRDAETLLPIIQAVDDRKSIIHSYEWKAYRSLQRSGYQHSTVNLSLNCVEPVTGVHTQNIESYWNVKKAYIKKMWGCHRNMLHWYLQECMWRDCFARNNNCFNNICLHIAHFYPFNN